METFIFAIFGDGRMEEKKKTNGDGTIRMPGFSRTIRADGKENGDKKEVIYRRDCEVVKYTAVRAKTTLAGRVYCRCTKAFNSKRF